MMTYEAWARYLRDTDQRALMLMASAALSDRVEVICGLLPGEREVEQFRAMALDSEHHCSSVWCGREVAVGLLLSRSSPRRVWALVIRDVTEEQMVLFAQTLDRITVPDDVEEAIAVLRDVMSAVELATARPAGSA